MKLGGLEAEDWGSESATKESIARGQRPSRVPCSGGGREGQAMPLSSMCILHRHRFLTVGSDALIGIGGGRAVVVESEQVIIVIILIIVIVQSKHLPRLAGCCEAVP